MILETSTAYATRVRFIEEALRSVHPKTILDIGCGTGEHLTQYIAQIFPDATIYGVDEDRRSIEYAKSRFADQSNLRFSIEIPAGVVFDAIIASEVLEHVQEPASFLSYCHQILAPSGKIIVTIPNGYGWSEIMAGFEDVLVMTGILPWLRRAKNQTKDKNHLVADSPTDTLAASPHINFFSFGRVRSLISKSGLRIQQYQGRMVFHNFLFSMILDRSEALSRVNARLARFLPSVLVSDWMFVATKTTEAVQRNHSYQRNRYEIGRARLHHFREKVETNAVGRREDLRRCTYQTQALPGPINKYFSSIPISDLRTHAKEIKERVEHFRDHRFDLLGSGWTKVQYGMTCRGLEGNVYPPSQLTPASSTPKNRQESDRIKSLIDKNYQPIDWQLDFKSGYRWGERTWYRDIRYGRARGADIKVPWELSRMQHLVQFCWAYALSKAGDPGFESPDDYVREFRNQVLDFIAANPPRFGVNWACAMDVAIRISNWLVAYDLFRAAGAVFDVAFEEIFRRSVYEHGKHIFENLEWDPVHRGNHYLTDVVGLLFVSKYLLLSPEIKSWGDFSQQELMKEIERQFLDDGGHFEASTSYHRYCFETALWGVAIAKSPLPSRLALAEQFLSSISKMDGSFPQIGDNDSGRFLKLDPVTKMGFGENIFSPPVPTPLLQIETGGWQDMFEKARSQANENNITQQEFPFPSGSLNDVIRAGFPDFGLYIFKSKRFYLSIRCGLIGHHGDLGGHAHNDQLSITLSIHGREVVVDPGTYVYTPLPEKRNLYRSVQAHNAPHWNGHEPGALDKGLFRLDDQARAQCLYFGPDGFLGVHYGFGAPVYRRVEFRSESLIITDIFTSTSQRPSNPTAPKIIFSPGYGMLQNSD